MKDYIKLAGTLCIITFVAAFLLGGTNAITKDRIAAAKAEKQQSAMRALIPEAENFEALEGKENIYVGKKGDDAAGICVTTVTSGYGGDIEMMVGFDKNMKLAGIEILGNSETAGLGANCTKEEFKAQFKGLEAPVTVVKGTSNGINQISAITGATITSNAVAAGIQSALDEVADYVGKGVED